MKYFIVIFIVIILSCSERRDSGDHIFKIGIENHDTILYSSLFDSIKYIQLEKTENSIIGYIQKLVVNNNFILLLSNSASIQSILVFDNNGNYFSKIDCQGRGPEEYLSVGTFTYQESDSTIFLYNRSGRNVKVYNIFGKYLRKIELNLLGEDIEYLPDGRIIFYSPSEYNLYNGKVIPKGIYLINSDGNYQRTLIEVPKNNSLQISGFSYFSKYEGQLNFLSSFDDKVYTFRKDSLITLYNLDFMNFELTNDLRSKPIEELNGKYVISKYSPIETEKYFITYLIISTNQTPQLLLIDKTQNIAIPYKYIKNDFDHLTGLFMTANKNKIYSAIGASDFKTLSAKYSSKLLTPFLEEGNPMLQILYLKK